MSETSHIHAQRPGAPLPPQPSITRWGTWLVAAVYYAENLNSFASVVNCVDANDSASTGIVQQLVGEQSVKDGLSFIRAHFACLLDKIVTLESSGISLSERTKIPKKLSTN